MGHGNGWPSPYTYDPNYTTKDGFGLNATSGAGDYNNKYYGEPYVSSLDLAPGAIVLLNHLCYASGNSEPGHAEPSMTVARQRADNYAAGFLKAGAEAVIADGHAGAEGYLRRIVHDATRRSRTCGARCRTPNGHVLTYASSRTPGATVFQDPNTTVDGVLSLARGPVARRHHGRSHRWRLRGHRGTSGSVSSCRATLPCRPKAPACTAIPIPRSHPRGRSPPGPASAIVDEPGQTTAEGARLVEVQGLDDPGVTGFMIATDLAPRDSTSPFVRRLDAGGPFSPNGDGQADGTTLQASFTESVAWTLRVRNASNAVLFQKTGTGATFAFAWSGIVSGAAVPDGTYNVTVSGVDAWGNAPATATRPLIVDTKAPILKSLTPGADTTQWFSPNGDGVRDTVTINATNSELGSLQARVFDAKDALVKSWTVANGSGAAAMTWNGRNAANGYARDGTYEIRISPRDAAGNVGAGVARTVTLIGALKSVSSSKTMFFPQDGDALARWTKLSFTLVRPMTVTWTVQNAAGETVATRLVDTAMPAGTSSWMFYGRRTSDGSVLPRGRYVSVVTATDGTLTATQTVAFETDAFTVRPSDATPGRGQSITVTVNSAESLERAPMLYVSQPGVARWGVRTKMIGTNLYRVTIRMKTGGGTGTGVAQGRRA